MNCYGRLHPVEFDEEYSWKLNDFSARDSSVIACRFVGYCIDNQPDDTTEDIYTPFFDRYYKDRKELFRRRNIQNISLIRKPKLLEECFLIEHIDDEKQGFEISKTLFAFLNKDKSEWYRALFNGYMEYLQERKDELNITDEAVNRGRDWIFPHLVDRLKLEELFVPSFFDKNFSTVDMLTRSERQSRFDVLCNRMEMVLSDETPVTNRTVGAIAYMIYSSEFVKPVYRKPSRAGERGHFSQLLKTICDIVKRDYPSDLRYNKYKPSAELIEIFSTVLNYF